MSARDAGATHVLTDFGGDRLVEVGSDGMGGAQGHRAVDLEIERDALAPVDVLDGDMMHRQPPPRGDQQHPLEDRLVVERDRVGGDGEIRLRPSLADPRRKLRLAGSGRIRSRSSLPFLGKILALADPRRPLQRQRAGCRDYDLADDLRAAGA